MRWLRCFLIPCFLLSAEGETRTLVINDDGGWCWFEDERSLVVKDRYLIVGSIAGGVRDPRRRGDVEVAIHDLQTGKNQIVTLHHSDDPREQRRWFDDHNSPAFAIRADGRVIAFYSLHGVDAKIYYRISSKPDDPTSWQPERVFVPSATSRVTYSNLHRLSRENKGRGRIYDFFRGLDNSFKPSYAFSDDDGDTWTPGRVFLDVPLQFRHRPYVKYASDGRSIVHFAYTDGHPRDFDNSVYHAYYRDGKLHRSDGAVIRELSEGLRSPNEGTRIFNGDADNVAWVSDLHLDGRGRPYLVYSVQRNSGGKPRPEHGDDHRYRYARWTGSRWDDFEIAFGGSRLYPGEDDYTGNLALDPRDPDVVFISTNAEPSTGHPLRSAADGRRHWEIYRGRTTDGGRKWQWTALTRDSTQDNIRPMAPAWNSKQSVLLWSRGKMRAYTDYQFEAVVRIEPRDRQ